MSALKITETSAKRLLTGNEDKTEFWKTKALELRELNLAWAQVWTDNDKRETFLEKHIMRLKKDKAKLNKDKNGLSNIIQVYKELHDKSMEMHRKRARELKKTKDQLETATQELTRLQNNKQE